MNKIIAIVRVAVGWIFLWAFLDKTFGLGYGTLPQDSWIVGGSPTTGFLKFATKGPFVDFFQGLAGSGLVDVLFMAVLLFVGLGLILGIWIRLASYVGALILILMYLAGSIWPEHNPFIDEHIIYALLMFVFPLADNSVLGISEWWGRRSFVRKCPMLK